MKGILFIDFLIQKDFLNTCSRQWSFLLNNQNARTNEISRYKSQIKAQIVGEQASVVEMIISLDSF